MLLIIGSGKLGSPEWPRVSDGVKDLDIIGKYEDVISFIKRHLHTSVKPTDGGNKIIAKADGVSYQVIEAEIAWSGSVAEEMMQHCLQHNEIFYSREFDTEYMYLTDVQSLQLRMTHRYLKNSPHFHKTMQKIREAREKRIRGLLNRTYDTSSAFPVELMKRREDETYDYSHPKLNVSKENFFAADGVPYVYDHDSIHVSVARWVAGVPAYTKFSSGEVYSSKEKFFNECSQQTRIRAVVEESCVLAIERSLVPFNSISPAAAFSRALEKVCTSITSGWFREFAWEHYDEAVLEFDNNYSKFWDNFQNDVSHGLVSLYNESKMK